MGKFLEHGNFLFTAMVAHCVIHPNLWNFLWKRHVGGDQHGHQYGGRNVKETSVIKFFITLELRQIEINTFSRARTLSKHPSFGLLESLVGPPFKCHATHKLGNLNVLCYKMRTPVGLKRCKT